MSEPTEEALPPREGRWFAAPEPVRWSLRGLPVSFGVFYASYVAVQALLLIFGKKMPGWGERLFGVGLLLFFVVFLLRLVTEVVARRRRRRDRAFSDAPPGIKEFAADVVIVVDGEFVGADRGVVWFEDGRLCFNGRGMSFTLASEDVVSRKWVSLHDPYADVPRDGLRLSVEGEAYVRIMPVLGQGFGFRLRLKRFLRASTGSRSSRQWPPLTPYEPSGDGLQRAVPLQHDVDGGALGVAQLDQR